MNIRKLALRTFAIFSVVLLSITGLARAGYSTSFFTSVGLGQGTISGGTLNMVQTIDGQTLNLTEGGAGAADALRYFGPRPDNGSGFGWTNNCGGLGNDWLCLRDMQRNPQCCNYFPFTDYNVTIVWSTTVPNNQSFKFDSTMWGPSGTNIDWSHKPAIIGVGLYTVDRKNTTGSLSFEERIVDPVNNRVCLARSPSLPDLAWHIVQLPVTLATTCAGTAWTYELINRTEINFHQDSAASQRVTVSTAYWVISLTSTLNNLDAYFNATVDPRTAVPYSLNWTCNRSVEDSYIIAAFKQNPGGVSGYVALNGNACPTGAQASNSIVLPVGTWLAGNLFSVRVQGYGSPNAGTVRFDRLVFVVQGIIPTVGGGIGGQDLSWIVFVSLCLSSSLFAAWKVKRWRERT